MPLLANWCVISGLPVVPIAVAHFVDDDIAVIEKKDVVAVVVEAAGWFDDEKTARNQLTGNGFLHSGSFHHFPPVKFRG